MIKGQVSFEFILILAIFLSILGLWLPNVVNLKDSVDEILEIRFERIAEKKICDSAYELRVIGGGTKSVSVFSYKEYSPDLSGCGIEGTVSLSKGYNNVSVSYLNKELKVQLV